MKKIFLLILLASISAKAQFFGNLVEKQFVSGSKANYIFLFDDDYYLKNGGKLPEPYLNGQKILIERSVDGKNYTLLDTLQPAKSILQLKNIWGDETVQALLADTSFFKLKSEAELLNLFQSTNSPFAHLFLFPEKLLLSIGLAYKDTLVEKNQTYYYKLKYMRGAKEILKGNITHGAENKTLKKLKLNFNQMSLRSIDSLISGAWYIQPIKNMMIQNIKVFGKRNAETEYRLIDSFKPKYSGDTLSASVFHKTYPADVMSIYLIPEDILGNHGINSDTATLIALSKGKLPFVENFKFKDSTDAVYLSWDPLPPHSFLSGYLLGKENAQRKFVVLDTIPLNITHYLDFNVRTGETYNYEIQPLPSPVSNLLASNFTGVRVSGSHVPNDRIFPPENVQVTQIGKHFRISWSPINDRNLNSYQVLFSNDPNERDFKTVGVVRGDTTFLDTTDVGDFSHLIRYYKVQTMSFGMKFSEPSSMASIIPKINIEIEPPMGLQIRNRDSFLDLSWEVSTKDENFIKGYNIYRKKDNEAWRLLNKTSLVLGTLYQDTTIVAGTYSYKVTGLSISDFESDFSIENEIDFKKELPPIPAQLQRVLLRNIPPGIEISWSVPVNTEIQSLKIFRREANNPNSKFSEIANIQVSENYFWDKNVVIGMAYQYVIEPVSSIITFAKEKPMAITRSLASEE